MRLLLQRVTRAEVRVADALIARIGPGLAVLVGVAVGDDEVKARMLAGKVAELRIFRDAEGRTNRSLLETGGEALVVSQFTLLADTRKGRRPSFLGAASPAEAERLYSVFSDALLSAGVSVQRGVFRAEMELELVNDGPMTIWLDSDAS
ncbi:MAG: D-aminoacyl-tRNA deacylase [Candidatus Limnocylindrales bacterium]